MLESARARDNTMTEATPRRDRKRHKTGMRFMLSSSCWQAKRRIRVSIARAPEEQANVGLAGWISGRLGWDTGLRLPFGLHGRASGDLPRRGVRHRSLFLGLRDCADAHNGVADRPLRGRSRLPRETFPEQIRNPS